MKTMIMAVLAASMLSGCATIGPRAGESPCAFGRRVMAETQRRLDQAQRAADTACAMIEAR